MKKNLCLLVGAISFFLSCNIGFAQSASSREKLLVGGLLEFPPYTYLDQSGVYTGYSVDVMRAIGEMLGIDNVLFYPATLEQNLKLLKQGKIDCIQFIRSNSFSDNDFIFVGSYLETPSVIFVSSESYDITNLEDLHGKRISVLNSDPSFEFLKKSTNYYLLPVGTSEEGFELLKKDKTDAYIGERLNALHTLGTQGLDKSFKIVGTEISRSQFGVLFRKDNVQLANLFKQAFEKMERTGKRDRMYYQWFGEGVQTQPLLSRQTIRWVMIFVGSSLLVAMIVLGWNLLLQRELELKAVEIEKSELHKKIAEEKSRFEAIVQSMTEGLMLVDPQGIIAYVNAPGAQYLGRRIEDLILHPLHVVNDYILSKIKEPEQLRKKLENAEANPTRPMMVEYTFTTIRRQDIRLKFFPVRNRHGEFDGRGILIEDVTHEREVDRLKSEFVSIASHELRTPMTSILGFSEIMLTKSLAPDMQKRYISQIHGEAERLTRILNDMLDISYLESGEGILEKKPINLSELVNEVVENFSAQIKDRREVRIQVHGSLPMVMVDRDKITQVLWNLLSNADKYSYPGRKVLIEIIERHEPTADWYFNSEELNSLLPVIEIQVIDFGEGIQQDQLSMIFIPFYRVETAVHTIRGTGLGLAIVKRIVEAHNGKVWANSEPGKETVFTVLLPVGRH